MASSIREMIDVCRDTGGFKTKVQCAADVTAQLHRAGKHDKYNLTLTPSVVDGDHYTFSLPNEFFGYPVGYYDANLYDDGLYLRTIRLNLYTNSSTGKTCVIDAECTDNRPEINTTLEECCEKCGPIRLCDCIGESITYECGDECPEPPEPTDNIPCVFPKNHSRAAQITAQLASESAEIAQKISGTRLEIEVETKDEHKLGIADTMDAIFKGTQ